MPIRATEGALTVNWFSIETLDDKGKRTYHNNYVTFSFGNANVQSTKRGTDLPATFVNVGEIAPCGQSRWKIENETFNELKTNV